MKSQILKAVGLFLLGGWCQAHAAIASPVVADYVDVFPGLTNVSLNVNLPNEPAPWFVRFKLLAPANVAIGVDGLDPFTLTSLRITEFDDTSVNTAFGTDDFPTNPFEPDTIDQLVRADNLAPNTYALAVSGSGNRSPVDFVTHLQVTAVPLPAALALFVSALAGLGLMRRRTS